MDKETQEESLTNWIGWIQKRMPEAKKGHNEKWLRVALTGYHKQRVKSAFVLDDVIIRCDFEENTECKNQNIKYTTGHCLNCGGLAIDL
tara:strand:+ start:52 stop:318 length:267 start_codon:yes stop_codon:yes gene_type:complete